MEAIRYIWHLIYKCRQCGATMRVVGGIGDAKPDERKFQQLLDGEYVGIHTPHITHDCDDNRVGIADVTGAVRQAYQKREVNNG